MPLDPSIIAGLRPAPIQTANPLDIITAGARLQDIQAQVEQRRLAGEAARQKAMDEAQIRRVMSAAPDVDTGITQLYAVNPRAAASLAEQVGKGRKEQLDAAGKDLENQGKRADLALRIARTVGDDGAGYGLARPAMVATSPVLDRILPPADAPWDPARWSQIMQAGVSGKDQLEQKQKVLDLFANGKFHESLGHVLSQPDITPEKWDQAITGAITLGMPKAVGDEFGGVGGFSPANVANAARLAVPTGKVPTEASLAVASVQDAKHPDGTPLTDPEKAALAITKLRPFVLGAPGSSEDVVSRALQIAQANNGGQPLTPPQVQAVTLRARQQYAEAQARPEQEFVTRNGNVIPIPKGSAQPGDVPYSGAAARPATVPEHKALAFYNRAKEAVDTLTTPDPTTNQTLEDSVSGLGVALGKVPVVGNYLQSEDAQRYTQAQRAFTEARLRSEAGARVSEQSYENDRKTYFTQPGDSAAVIEQKRKARETVLNGLAGEAGKAYDEYYGTPYTRTTGTTKADYDPGSSTPPVVGDTLHKNGVAYRWDGGGWQKQTATDAGRVRVVGPNGQTGTVPAGTTLPPGWRTP